jgi:thiol-disulfide isomerase/thioredoxin
LRFSIIAAAATLVAVGLYGALRQSTLASWGGAVAKPAEPARQAPVAATDVERPAAPDLEGGVGWLNASRPIHLRDLRGKIVVIDFWTFCCINCIHTLPGLARLEKKYPNQLVVIGVHSGKFDNERSSDQIRKAIQRYEITHPVVNDANMKIWNAYSVRSWPTLFLIDPEGRIVARGSGEGLCEALDRAIARLIDTYRDRKLLDEGPPRLEAAGAGARKGSPLYFPGKILADGPGNRLFIADSTHHRIVITDLHGKKIAVAGSGQPGRADGLFATASFNDPQGMALRDERLFVADRKNHLIRTLDLKASTVTTLAGTGTQGTDRSERGPALEEGLNSPWDLCLLGNSLFIAMAGHHQIWRLELDRGIVAPYAGNGREDLLDGARGQASFAQPSGLTTDGRTLFVADSETSSIRALALDGNGQVRTLVGQGLFEFGDRDGTGDQVRLQHALGVAWHDGRLYVADTYNGRIKVIDPATRVCKALNLVADGGSGEQKLNEPGGLSFAGDTLFVADTNAHTVQVVDVKSGHARPLELDGVAAP